MLLRQWCAPHQYALVQSMGLSQHSVILALAVSLSPWLIEWLGSWRIAYAVLGGFFTAQILAWVLVAREKHARRRRRRQPEMRKRNRPGWRSEGSRKAG